MKKNLILFWFLSIFAVNFLFAESNYWAELEWAYNYAYNIWITTMMPISNANMYGNLIRSHMAKMMSNYATEILDLVPNTGKVCEFDDIDGESDELKWYIIKACQLDLMWVGITSFNPSGNVSRAQFGTVLSRAIYGDVNNGGDPYYVNHLNALKTDNIMTVIDTPSNLEVRWYVMLMMKRADELINNLNTWGIVIDLTPPTANVVYSTTGNTTGNVTAYLTGRSESITGVNTYSHVFDENGSFIFYFQDLAGNAGSVSATVNRIDKTSPTANINLSPIQADYTSWNIVATLTWYSENITITNNAGLSNYTFTGNGNFVFNFVDAAGNTGSTTATVSYWTGS